MDMDFIRSMLPLEGWKAGAAVILSQFLASYIVNAHSYQHLHNLHRLFQPWRWEREGRIYEDLFHIRGWKDYVPSISHFNKKTLDGNLSAEYLSRYVLESIRAELCHDLSIIFGLLLCLAAEGATDRRILLYLALLNLPCIMIQRYNRPRFERILNRPRKDGRSGIVEFWLDEDGSEIQEEGERS